MATKEEIAAMTGAQMSTRAPQYPLDEVSILGKRSDSEKYPFAAGHFRLKKKSVPLAKDQKEYEQEDLGNAPLDVVFLKIRRIMVEYRPDGSLQTNEHNAKADTVSLFGDDGGVQIGTGYELWEKNQRLKTHQVVYAYVPKLQRIIRLIVKGISLGGSQKIDGVTSFYEYLGNFSNEKLHAHEHFTRLVPFETASKAGKIWGINFQRGSKLDDEKIAKVEGMVVDVHKFCTESDAYYAASHEKKGYKKGNPVSDAEAPQSAPRGEGIDTIEYPEDEVDTADIPF